MTSNLSESTNSSSKTKGMTSLLQQNIFSVQGEEYDDKVHIRRNNTRNEEERNQFLMRNIS